MEKNFFTFNHRSNGILSFVLLNSFLLLNPRYLVDPASSDMLVSKAKPCTSKYRLLIQVKPRMAH